MSTTGAAQSSGCQERSSVVTLSCSEDTRAFLPRPPRATHHLCKTRLPVGYIGRLPLGVLICISWFLVKIDFNFFHVFVGYLYFFCDWPVYVLCIFVLMGSSHFLLIFRNSLHMKDILCAANIISKFVICLFTLNFLKKTIGIFKVFMWLNLAWRTPPWH